MSKKFLRFRDLKSRGIVSNWQTLRRWIRDQGFPEGVKLGPNTRAWPEDDVNAWLDGRPVAPSQPKAGSTIEPKSKADPRQIDREEAIAAKAEATEATATNTNGGE